MKSKKFLMTKWENVEKMINNWKCGKCGSIEEPCIIAKKEDNGEIVEMYIKCKECDRTITVSGFSN